MLPVLVLAALTALPATAPLTDLPPAADPCIALTPAVINQLRTTGTLTPLVSDAVSTSTLIVAGRSLTGCPPTSDPDPAAIRAHVCPLLTAEGVEALANRFGATPAAVQISGLSAWRDWRGTARGRLSRLGRGPNARGAERIDADRLTATPTSKGCPTAGYS